MTKESFHHISYEMRQLRKWPPVDFSGYDAACGKGALFRTARPEPTTERAVSSTWVATQAPLAGV